MTKEELKKEAIKFAVDYPTSYGKGYKHKDLRIAYLAGAELREKRIEELEAQIEEMKCCQNCKHFDFDEPKYCHKGVYNCAYVCDKWELGD